MCAKYPHGLVLYILLHQIGTFLAAMGCMSSIPTVQYVPSCPSTEKDWFIAAERKMCSSVGQNCTSRDQFVYHCLVNSFFNATLEVCAPIWKMNGYCPEFNVPGQRIQHVSEKDCTKFLDKCPAQYNSSEVYKYPRCLDLNHLQFPDTTRQSVDVPSSQSPHNEWKTLSIILIVIMIAIIMVTSGILLVCFRKCRNAGSSKETGEQGELEQMVENEGTETHSESNSDTSNASRPKKKALNKAFHPDTEETTGLVQKVNTKGKETKDKYVGTILGSSRDNTSRNENDFIVAAVNFGRSHTKYGYSFVSGKSRSVDPELYVQPSCFLLSKPGGRCLSFGHKAIDECLNLESPYEHVFEEFSILDTVSNLEDNFVQNYQTEDDEKLLDRFVYIFNYLKKILFEKVATKFPNTQITDWILCVPFTWKKGAEEFLKSTAKQAGITSNLHIVKEHQAVLSWCSNIGGHVKDGDSLFVDLGGGGTKIYSVNAEEMCQTFTNEGTVGGLSVWHTFQTHIEDTFTAEVYESFKEKCRKSNYNLYLDMCHSMFRNETKADTQLQRFSQIETLQEISRRINHGTPSLDFQTIKETLLEELIKEITECLADALTGIPNSKTVYVFGGASKSDILYQHVKSMMGDVIRIPDPDMAIIEGSIIEKINICGPCRIRSAQNSGTKYGHHGKLYN